MNLMISSECQLSGMSQDLKTAAIFRQPSASAQFFLCLNELLDKAIFTYEINEEQIENWMNRLEGSGGKDSPIYWLLWIRLMEAALLCAGNYVDNCEFSAAGGLLVNPRCIRVHIDGVIEPVNKKRHLALTDQFNAVAKTKSGIIRWLGKNTHLEITKKPLLPDLYERLKKAGIISEKYLDSVYQRMNKIADVIGFLSAYHISDSQMFYKKLYAANAESDFIRSNLCNFNCDIFFGLGLEILKLIENDNYKSVFVEDYISLKNFPYKGKPLEGLNHPLENIPQINQSFNQLESEM